VNDTEFNINGALAVVEGTELGTGNQAVLDNFAVGQLLRMEESYDSTA
jgi:hypothetical protein